MDIKTILGGANPYVQSKVDKGEAAEATTVTKGKAKLKSRESSGDKVSVSSDAKLVAEAARTASESPDVRVDRVEQLRQQVQTGNYTPDSRRIAQKLVESDIEFLR